MVGVRVMVSLAVAHLRQTHLAVLEVDSGHVDGACGQSSLDRHLRVIEEDVG